MLNSMKALGLILVVFALACSHAGAQGRSPDKPGTESVRVVHTDREDPDVKQGASASGNPSVLNEEDEPRGAKIRTAAVLKEDLPVPRLQDEPVSPPFGTFPETDMEEMRKAWALSADFGRKIKPERTPPRQGSNGDVDDPVTPPTSEKFHWRPAIYQSMVAQGFQHGYALIFQEKTRRALKGPFFRDYWESVKAVRGWSDENKFFTNYIAHPMQGSFTGFIFVQNHDRAKKQQFNESPQYWKDRLKALAWSAAWSTNWELGPVSQSSIGNVGLYGRQGWVDLVITPTAGTAWMIVEEALDRYVIRHHDSKSLTRRIILRSFLNPTRSVANVFRFKVPWHRDHRE